MINEVDIKPSILNKKFHLNIERADAYGPPYIDPIIRLIVYLYIILVSGNVFMGWTGFQELLYKAGTFEELCDESTLEIINIRSNKIIDCPARKAAINNLFVFAFATNILFCIFVGAIMDFFGPKITFIIGQLTCFICWILIGIFPKNGPLIRLIMVILGLAAEALFLPLTTVSLYFPENKSTILSITGSIRTLSFFVTSILSYIYVSPHMKKESFWILTTSFSFIVYFGCFLIGSFMIQWKFFKKSEVNKKIEDTNEELKKPKTHQDVYHKCVDSMIKVVKHPKFLQTILFTIAAALYMSSIEFLNMSQREMLTTTSGESAIDVFRYIQILTFITGIIIGIIADKIGTAETMIVLEIFLLLSYVFIGFDKYITKIFGCAAFYIGGALHLTMIYCYIYETLPPERIGFILGFVLIICGTMVLLNVPLYKAGLKCAEKSNFANISRILMGYLLCSIVSTGGVIYLKRRNKGNNKRKVDENQK